MALPKSGIRVPRRSIRGMEGAWAKMWDPPRERVSEAPDFVPPTNPVPGRMAQKYGVTLRTANTVQRRLIEEMQMLETWDRRKEIEFMTFGDADFDRVIRDVTGGPGTWPGPTIRVPRGAVFHADSQGAGPPPHTIHWHGLEPTPMNDGVGHCSMEIGQYTYQLQPNFIGTYFYHCHRNTVQHFEFGLYGMFLVEPPNAFVGANWDRYPRRTAANLAGFPQFADKFVGGDPVWGVGGADDVGVGDPNAFTVEYDAECLWVFDDRDSVWSDLAANARSFYPGGANTGGGPLPIPDPNLPGGTLATTQQPGVDDQFPHGFFNDFNADYWYVTGVPIPASRGGTGEINPPAEIPSVLNSGVEGMQVEVDANVGETVLVRVLNGAYNDAEVTFPVDVTIIAFDGRALGVPPFARYNHAFVLPANTPYRLTTARRFDALIRSDTRVDGFATVKFFDTRGSTRSANDPLLVTGRIPVKIN